MKLFKRFLIVLCIAVELVAVGTYFIAVPTPMPEYGDVLIEDEPEANPLRTSLAVDGVSGSRFYIQSPKAEALNVLSVSAFGASPNLDDNSAALNEAFVYCQTHPGTRLVFEKGVYYLSDALLISHVTDLLVDGNGAKIVYDYGSGLINIKDSSCVEMRDLTIDWDWDKIPLSALAYAVDVPGEKNTVDFVFESPAYARKDMMYAITQCDEETNTYGAKGTLIETYDGQNPDVIKSIEKVSENTLRVVHNGALDRFGGKKYIIRSTAYGGSIFNIDRCRDVTINKLNLYGGTGMGLVIGDKTSHFALRDLFIGPDPACPDHYTSMDADAVHINDADGCFLIEGCDFSRQGDDDVNINSGIGIIKGINGRTVTLAADTSMDTTPGDTIVFRDENFNALPCVAVVEKSEHTGTKLREVTFRDPLPAGITEGCMMYNKNRGGGNYVIRNNYFHEHRARGLLLQTSNGLVENNVFYKTSHDAIRIVMDISPGMWHEGTGADNIVIRNNRFIECGVIGTEVIEVGTHIDSKSSRSYGFTNITVTGNEFRDLCGYLMVVNNVNNFVFRDNTITVGDAFRPDVSRGRSYFMWDCVNVDFSDNVYTDASLLTKVIRSSNPFVWARVNLCALTGKGGK